MKILVIDDAKRNIASAHFTLQGHELKTATTIEEAYDILEGKEMFDAVLTDLFLPLGSFRGAMNEKYGPPTSDLPAGLVFAIRAVNKGIRTIICTDATYHADWICNLLALIMYSYRDDTARTAFIEARTVGVEEAVWDEAKQKIVPDPEWYTKNSHPMKHWLNAMKRSWLFPEVGQGPESLSS